MNKWLLVGGGVLLLAWAPFLYTELTSSEVQKKGRELPTVDLEGLDDEEIEAILAAAEQKAEAEEQGEEAEPSEAPSEEETEEPAEAPAEPEAPAAPEPEPVPDEAEDEGSDEDGEGEADKPPPPPPRLTGPARVLKDAFESEHRDALWAEGAETALAEFFEFEDEDEMPEDMLQEVACRKAVCRVELKWSTEHAAGYMKVHQGLVEEYGAEIGIAPQGTPDDEGNQSVHIYIPREGYTVADLSE